VGKWPAPDGVVHNANAARELSRREDIRELLTTVKETAGIRFRAARMLLRKAESLLNAGWVKQGQVHAEPALGQILSAGEQDDIAGVRVFVEISKGAGWKCAEGVEMTGDEAVVGEAPLAFGNEKMAEGPLGEDAEEEVAVVVSIATAEDAKGAVRRRTSEEVTEEQAHRAADSSVAGSVGNQAILI
jgi:hypothetical protein